MENKHGDILNLNPGSKLNCEVAEGWAMAREGNFWPIAILEAMAGSRTRVASLIRAEGLAAGSSAADFVGDLVEGKFKATKGDKNKQRAYEMLSRVSLYNYARLYAKQYPENIDRNNFSPSNPMVVTLDDVYRRVAAEFHVTKDAVEKLVTRRRQLATKPK